MNVEPSDPQSDFDGLFEEARKRAGVEFLFTLVRVDGIQSFQGYEDEFLVLRREINEPAVEQTLEKYRRLASFPGPLKVLLNLVNCSEGKLYEISPFRELVKGTFPNLIQPTRSQLLAFVATRLRDAQQQELAASFEESYRPELFDPQPDKAVDLKSSLGNLQVFLKNFLDRYFRELALAAEQPRFIKLPGSLDVLELLVDEEMGGLNGLRLHFPQGCKADFFRTRQGISGVNLEFGPPVTFLMMSMSPSSNEYRVEGKRLYEIGLEGRYNKLGEWKPLIYPGDATHLIEECRELSDDPDVQGVLMYMRLTGHRCIEFAFRSNLETPGSFTGTESNDLWIWKCPKNEDTAHANVRVYDGWLQLRTGDVQEIEEGLQSINWLVSMMFFPYGASYSWRNKYRTVSGGNLLLLPTHEDMKTVDSILKRFPYGPGGQVLSSGIDWYNMGNSASNPFNRFLCYYIAFESVAVQIHDGTDLGVFAGEKPTKAERKAQAIGCIQSKYAALYSENPIDFVSESYFECVTGLKAKAKKVAAAVFGPEHQYLEGLFVKPPDTKVSLSDLRSELAHGGMTLLNKDHEGHIRQRVHEMEEITREFLLRVLFRINAGTPAPGWSQAIAFEVNTADPRSTMWTSTESTFPAGTSWKIRPEWCE